jgi:YVTN family beta-propeller protein
MDRKILPAVLVTVVVFFAACSQPAPVNLERTNNSNGSSAAPGVMPKAGFVYTADERGNSISVVDLSTGQVRTTPIRISPHNVQVSLDGRLLFVVGMVGGMTGDQPEMEMGRGRLLVFETAKMKTESAIDIEVGREPAHVIIDKENKLAYASNAEDNTVSVVDVVQRKIVGEIKTGASPHRLRMSPDGREIYVANTGDNSVSVIDVAQAREAARIPVGKAPAQVGFTPDGRRIYVSSTVENSVAVIDTAQRKRIATVPVGRKPIQVFATPDGRYVYVANEGSKENPDNTVSVIGTATNEVVATVVTGNGAHGVVVSEDGSRVFIANTVDSTVSVIDTGTQTVTRSIKVGEGSGGITFRSGNR